MVLAKRGIELIVDIIGEILAFFTVILILLMCINGTFGIIKNEEIMGVLTVVREIAILAVVGLKGLEFSLKKSWILTIVFGAILIAIATFMFFPGSLPTWLGGESGAVEALLR